jgi:SAM-dependent methyltransferase
MTQPQRTLPKSGPFNDEFARLAAQHGWRIEDHAICCDAVWTIGGQAALSYPEQGNNLLAPIEANSFWFRHRNRVIERVLAAAGRPSALWEVGSGNGFVARHLQRSGIQVVAVEPGPDGARNAARRGVPSLCGLFEHLRLPNNSLPAVGCFDVLEHLENPACLLAEIRRVLIPGGILAITVPAMSWLWSQTDEVSGHFRRYNRDELNSLLRRSGFLPWQCEYVMMAMVPPLFLLRCLPERLGRRSGQEECLQRSSGHLTKAAGFLGRCVEGLLLLEWLAGRVIPPFCGTSIAAVYRKPADA